MTRKPPPAPLGKDIPVYQFKARLSEYLHAVEDGRELTVTAYGRPVARVVPLSGVPVRKAELDPRDVLLPPPPRNVRPEALRRAMDEERGDTF